MDTVHIAYSQPQRFAAESPTGFKEARRIQRSLLAGLEKRTLIWLAERTPPAINSDHLTALGAFAMLLAGVSYGWARWHHWALLLAIFFLAVNWLGDSLDGTLARHRQQQRPRYGFYVDHILDAFGTLFLLVGLALSGYMHPTVAIALLVAYLMLSIEAYLATYTVGAFTLSFFKLSPTELRILLAIGNIALLLHPMVHLWGRTYRLFDVGGVIAIAGMLVVLLLSAVRNTRILYQQEPIR
jgi:phosphatidylglycerophosphate synthase